MDGIILGILAICVAMSAFFSATEIAVVSIGRVHLRRIMKEGRPGSGFLLKLKKDQRRTIVTILIGNNLVNITASTIAAAIAIDVFGELGVGIATGVMTFVLLVLGEIVPKSFAGSHPERFALFASPVMYYISLLLTPLVLFFDFFARLVSSSEKKRLSEKDIHAMVELGVEENVLEPAEQKLIERVLRFNDIPVREVMVPFKRFTSLDAEMTVSQAAPLVARYGFSRFPVFSADKANLVGVVRGRDLVGAFAKGHGEKPLKELMIRAPRVAEGDPIDDVFRLFQKTHNHMGFVIDAETKVVGLVTMEDIIEEIVGEFESDGMREFAGHA